MARALNASSLLWENIVPDEANGWRIEIPTGISLMTLRDSAVGRTFLHQQHWYNQLHWSRAEIPPGTYRLRLPVPVSNDKTFREQQQLLLPGESVAPVALVAAALLCIAQSGAPDPLKTGWVRCAETTAHGRRVVLFWCGGWLRVGDWNGNRSDFLWLAAAGTS